MTTPLPTPREAVDQLAQYCARYQGGIAATSIRNILLSIYGDNPTSLGDHLTAISDSHREALASIIIGVHSDALSDYEIRHAFARRGRKVLEWFARGMAAVEPDEDIEDLLQIWMREVENKPVCYVA